MNNLPGGKKRVYISGLLARASPTVAFKFSYSSSNTSLNRLKKQKSEDIVFKIRAVDTSPQDIG